MAEIVDLADVLTHICRKRWNRFRKENDKKPSWLAGELKVSDSVINAIMKGKSRLGEKKTSLSNFAHVLGIKPAEVLQLATSFIEQDVFPYADGTLPTLITEPTPDALDLQWGSNGCVTIRAKDLIKEEDHLLYTQAQLDQALTCPVYTRPTSGERDENRSSEASSQPLSAADQSNLAYVTFKQAERMSQRTRTQLVVLNRWAKRVRPAFALLASAENPHLTDIPYNDAINTKQTALGVPSAFSITLARERSASKAFEAVRKVLSGSCILASAESPFSRFASLLKNHFECPILDSGLRIAAGRSFSWLLSQGRLRRRDLEVLCAVEAPQYWALSGYESFNKHPLRVVFSDLDLFPQDRDLQAKIHNELPNINEIIELSENSFSVIVAVGKNLGPAQLNYAAGYFQMISARLKEMWNDKSEKQVLIDNFDSVYSSYGGFGPSLTREEKLSAMAKFLAWGMHLAYDDKYRDHRSNELNSSGSKSSNAFVDYRSYEKPANFGDWESPPFA